MTLSVRNRRSLPFWRTNPSWHSFEWDKGTSMTPSAPLDAALDSERCRRTPEGQSHALAGMSDHEHETPFSTAGITQEEAPTPTVTPNQEAGDGNPQRPSETLPDEKGTEGKTEGQERSEIPRALPSIQERWPVILGVAVVACSVVASSSLALQWMARHGGGTGNPVEASSEVDNMPIPTPRITSVNMMSIAFQTGMRLRISYDGHSGTWTGDRMSGDLPIVTSNDSNGNTILTFYTQGNGGDILIDFADSKESHCISFNATMGTQENGTLTVTGNAGSLASSGTVRISPMDCRIGVFCDRKKANVSPSINVATIYTVGSKNVDYAGTYVSSGASLDMGQDMAEAYLTADTRSVSVLTPDGFKADNSLQASRTVIRRNGQKDSFTGSPVLTIGETHIAVPYEALTRNSASDMEDSDDAVTEADAVHVVSGSAEASGA